MAAFDYGASAGGFRRRDEAGTKERGIGREIGRDIGRLDDTKVSVNKNHEHGGDTHSLRDETVCAFKVYDQCRWQDCLTGDQIGPAHAAEDIDVGGTHYAIGDAVVPPAATVSVTADDLTVLGVEVVDKRPSPFKKGYWDINLKFVFTYDLKYFRADGSLIGSLHATSVYTRKVCLFGSADGDTVFSTDLPRSFLGQSATFDSAPFVLVESKAVVLSADIRPVVSLPPAENVFVTIGLFAITQIFRLVQLSVLSHGFVVPPPCVDCNPVNPCDFFTGLDFPLDIFAPPQKPEFEAGIVSSVPNHDSSVVVEEILV